MQIAREKNQLLCFDGIIFVLKTVLRINLHRISEINEFGNELRFNLRTEEVKLHKCFGMSRKLC